MTTILIVIVFLLFVAWAMDMKIDNTKENEYLLWFNPQFNNNKRTYINLTKLFKL